MSNPEEQAYFDRLERGTSALRALTAELPSPAGTIGTDSSGSVGVALGADGLPERIDLDDGWRSTVGAEGLAAAVTAACRGAVQARSHALSTAADQSGYIDRATAVFAYMSGRGPEPPDLPRSSGSPTGPASMPDLSDIAADIVASDLTDRVETALQAGPPQYSGSAGLGHLTLTLDPSGTLTCDADPDWVGRQETHVLRETLSTALAGLHAERRAAATSASPLTRYAAALGALASGYPLPG
jgi:hypothetical protein